MKFISHPFFNYSAEQAQSILARLSNFKIQWHEIISSSNDILKHGIKSKTINQETAVISWQQTNGRGQHQRQWQSIPKQCLMMSIYFNLSCANIPVNLSMVCGISVKNVLQKFIPEINIKLKYPNDIMQGNKKLGGILTEIISSGGKHHIVIGLGLNWYWLKNLDPNISASGLNKHLFSLNDEQIFNLIAELINDIHKNSILCSQYGFEYFAPIWHKSAYSGMQKFILPNGNSIRARYSHIIANNIYIKRYNKLLCL